MMKAEFMEEMGSVEEVKGFLNDIVEKKCPELLEAMVFYVEFLLRHDDRDGAEELLERFSTEGEWWGSPVFEGVDEYKRRHACFPCFFPFLCVHRDRVDVSAGGRS